VITHVDSKGTNNLLAALALQPDGKIVVAGTSGGPAAQAPARKPCGSCGNVAYHAEPAMLEAIIFDASIIGRHALATFRVWQRRPPLPAHP
jgi:hypothetical protein